MGVIRILFIADTHLGFDYPFNPRIHRRRRGDDFFANYRRVLEPAFQNKIHAVIHGGDLLFRSRVPARLVDRAMEPLKTLADRGIKVYIVPGNHERSRIPFGILSLHPGIFIFDRPRTFIFEKNGTKIALAGFPYFRENIRNNFPDVLERTGWRFRLQTCDAILLCVHHCFEGATVGPGNYTFLYDKDVIRHADIPKEFIAVLSGHIHRFQVLTRDLRGRTLATPVFYPGSIERTSFAEKQEKKGYLTVELLSGEKRIKPGLKWHFHKLPVRPMVYLSLSVDGLDPAGLKDIIRRSLRRLDPHSIVRIKIQGRLKKDCFPVLHAAYLRELSPREMNISIRFNHQVVNSPHYF